MIELRTERLVLRDWRDDDLGAYAALNADPQVMEFFPSTLARDASDDQAARIRAHLRDRGFGFWAVEVPGVSPFIGFIGLAVPTFDAPFMPAVEIGWRIARAHWNRGYATEGARAALAVAFERLRLDEVVSFTVVANARSRRVMERIGMQHDPEGDFDHPRLAEGHPLRRHVLYRVRR
ncbi:MAG: GNAT family N-acetyltransferase [Deltaproteobacteria bacterium]|nr:GNAT family N-acetyltransferase [Deltaproteobacteria bacterium]